jgi:hypothetical protein
MAKQPTGWNMSVMNNTVGDLTRLKWPFVERKKGSTLSSINCAHPRGYLDRCLRARVNAHTAVANYWSSDRSVGTSRLAA